LQAVKTEAVTLRSLVSRVQALQCRAPFATVAVEIAAADLEMSQPVDVALV
jgi:hypothetical protein